MSGEMVQILVVLATIAVHVGSALHVEVWPKVVNQHLTNVVDVYCQPNDTPVWKQNVIIVVLGKTGQSPMVILEKTGLKFGKNMEARMTAEGHIDEVNITESFIKLSIKEPSASDGGQYVCKIFYMDAEGSLKEGKAFGNVTVDNNNNEVVHTHLLKRLSELEKQLRGLEDHTKEKDAKVETELEHQANDTRTLRRQHEKDIDTLKTQHEKDIDALKTQHEKDIDTLKTQHEKDIDALKTQHEQDIDSLKTQLKTFETQTTKQITKCMDVVHQANDTELVRRQHEQDIDSLKTQLKTFETQTTKQITKCMDAVHQVNGTEVVRRQHEQDIDLLKTQLMTLENQTTNHITKANLQSGFVAGLKYVDSLSYYKTYKFRDVQLNIGSNFDADTGVYTAPWDGLYTFFLTVMIQQGKYCYLDIRVNERAVSRLWARDADNEDQSSVSAFVSLKAGDTVDVYGYSITGGTTLYAYAYPETYFSGFLVKAT